MSWKANVFFLFFLFIIIIIIIIIIVIQEAERGGPRHAELQSSRAPLQMQSSNVPPIVASSAGQAVSSKPLLYPSGLGSTKMPLAQVPGPLQVC